MSTHRPLYPSRRPLAVGAAAPLALVGFEFAYAAPAVTTCADSGNAVKATGFD
jgi:hypothetical protein